MRPQPTINLQHRWWGKLFIAFTLGGAFCVGMMGFIGALVHCTGNPREITTQYVMWIALTLWVVCLCICFLFRSVKQTLLCFACVNIVTWAAFYLLQRGSI